MRGIRLHLFTPKVEISQHCYCPREGYKVASLTPVQVALSAAGYCPREGYKVASAGFLSTLPARGAVTVPVRGIRLHPTAGLSGWSSTSYCPREGYKVASHVDDVDLQLLGYCPREGYKVASVWAPTAYPQGWVTVPVRGIRLHRIYL